MFYVASGGERARVRGPGNGVAGRQGCAPTGSRKTATGLDECRRTTDRPPLTLLILEEYAALLCEWKAQASTIRHDIDGDWGSADLLRRKPMERKGIEPSTSALRTRRSPN